MVGPQRFLEGPHAPWPTSFSPPSPAPTWAPATPAASAARACSRPSSTGSTPRPLSVTVSARELDHALHSESGANTLITLKLDGDEDALALARQIQRHPTRNELVHVDFVRVRRDVAVDRRDPAHARGRAAGREGRRHPRAAVLLPHGRGAAGQHPDRRSPSTSPRLALGDQLHVADLPIPPGVAVQHEPDELVAQVSIPRGLEEEEAEAAEGEEGEGAEGEGGEGAEASASDGGGDGSSED